MGIMDYNGLYSVEVWGCGCDDRDGHSWILSIS